MDTTPPQAPPALTQAAFQEAAGAYDRLVTLQAWLAVEQADIPGIPEAVGAGTLAPYLAQLDAFWNTSSTNAPGEPSRRAALTRRVASAALDLAVLAHEDGNLEDAPLALIREAVATEAGGAAAHLKVRELMFGDAPYAGMLLLQDVRVPDRTLVFSTDAGWESFATLTDAHAAIEVRARYGLASNPDLPGIARQHLLEIGADAFVTSREITGKPFETLVERAIAMQRDKLRQAWFESALALKAEPTSPLVTDAAFDAVRLDRVVNVEAMLAMRHAAVMEAHNTARLARVPAQVAADWRDAEEQYRSTLDSVATRESDAGLPAPVSLTDYAVAALSERLKALGVAQHPEDIRVRIDRGADVAARLESLQALFQGPEPAHIPLVDFAYQNISTFDPVRLSATAGDGTPIDGLNDRALRDLVRSLDLASRYAAYVESTFRSGTQAAMRREHASSLQRSHMKLLAAEARLSYYLEEAPRSFRADHAERGFRWVKAALDSPVAAHRAQVERHDVVVRQMTYLGTPLRDLLVFGVRNPASVPSIVLFTPGAPDGITFREFDDRAQAAREFFYHPAFREYLLDRLPTDYARVLPNGASREFAGNRLANWVLGSSSSAAYTRTEAPFEEREVASDFLEEAYETDVQLGSRNARKMTRSAEQANWEWIVDWPRSVMTNKIAHEAIQGVFTAPARAAQAAWRFYDNVKAGDHAQAASDFADFYNTSLSMAGPVYAVGNMSMAHAIAGARFRVAGRLVEVRSAVQPTVEFERRFLAENIRKTGHANREGIFAIEGKTYVEQNGHMYAVRYDTDYATWRLSRPNAGSAFRGPAIQRTGSGGWTYNNVGLRGGNPPAEIFNEYVHEFELAFPDPFERDLVRTQMQREVAEQVPSIQVTAAQRVRWDEAVNRAIQRNRVLAATRFASAEFPHNMVVPRIPAPQNVPPGYLAVAAPDVPETLWYYGSKPYKESAMQRLRSGSNSFSLNWASLRTELIDRRVTGIRLTTVPPTAPTAEIQAATGLQTPRGQMFAVRIHPRTLLSVSQRDVLPQADLLLRQGGPAGNFVMRSPRGGAIEFYRHQHEVIGKLP